MDGHGGNPVGRNRMGARSKRPGIGGTRPEARWTCWGPRLLSENGSRLRLGFSFPIVSKNMVRTGLSDQLDHLVANRSDRECQDTD
jgi:hypothetical protein